MQLMTDASASVAASIPVAIPTVILVHLWAALGAAGIGAAVLLMRRGTPLHRLLGRLWVGLMLVTALSSFGIRTHGGFSWIHILSVVSLVSITVAVAAAMRGNIRVHRRAMTNTYVGLAVAGLFTLLPGRLLGNMVWSSLGLIG